MRRRHLCAPLLAVAVLLGGCGSGSTTSTTTPGSPSVAKGPSGKINVFAAASLKDAFAALGKQFEAAHPGTSVTFSFGPSSGLAQQITQGAPADVFASASPKNMAVVTAAGAATKATTFATNVMQIAVPPSNPAKVTGVGDLAKSGIKVALCQAQVPCGVVAAKVFANAKLKVVPVTEEVDVKSVLAKVQLGEVDAGVVYVTDVQAAGAKVKGIAIPSEVNASTAYPIAVLKASANAATAAAFVDYVLSPSGHTVLTAKGFASP